jgi:hypothetical protein
LALLSGLLGSTAAEAVTTTVSAVLDRPYVFPGPDDRFPDFYTDYLAVCRADVSSEIWCGNNA